MRVVANAITMDGFGPRQDSTVNLRDYQIKAVEDLRSRFSGGRKRLILQMPTGSGKTVVACEIIRRSLELGRKVIFLVNRRELAFQASEKLEEYGIPYRYEHAIVMSGYEYFPAAPVQICSIQTLYSRRRQLAQLDPSLIIYDECHESVAPSRRKVLSHFENAYWVGLSATPTRHHSRGNLGMLWEEIVSGPRYATLISSGHLVPTRVFLPSIPDLTGAKVGSDGNYLQNADLRQRMESKAIYGDVIKEFKKHAAERTTICFCVDRAHSRGIADLFIQNGFKAAHIDGDTPKEVRDEAIKDLKSGSLQIVTNCQVFGEGLDIPRASCVINLKPTKSLVWFRQSLNRVQRPAPGKTDAILLDHTGSVLRFGFPDSDDVEWVLDSEKDSFESLVNAATKKDKEQAICSKCGSYLEGTGKCPGCGYEYKKLMKLPPRFKGSLKELSRKKAKKESGKLDYQKEWMKCLAVAAHRRGTVQSAAGHFRQVTGMRPDRAKVSPLPDRSQWNIAVQALYPGFVRKKRSG